MEWTAFLLEGIISYGAPMVGGILLLGAMGVPLPGTLVVIAAGAFMRQELLDLYTTPVLAMAGAVAGDSFVYGIGRFANRWIERRFGEKAAWKNAKESFDSRGGYMIFLTRWLITPLAIPTNLVAGSSGYSVSRFFCFDIAGEVVWIALYGGLGYTFGSQWELITELISNFSGLIISVLAVAAGIYLLVRFWHSPKEVVGGV